MLKLSVALLSWMSIFTSMTALSATDKSYPTRPIRFIVGFPPGGGNDALTRVIAPPLSEKFGVPVVIDNRPGAGGNLAAQLTAAAPADGYTPEPVMGLGYQGSPPGSAGEAVKV